MLPYRIVIYLRQLSLDPVIKQALFIGLRYNGEYILKISPRKSLKDKKRKNWKLKDPFKFIKIGLRNVTYETNFSRESSDNKLTDNDFNFGTDSIILYDLKYTSLLKFQKAIFKIQASIINSQIEKGSRLNILFIRLNELNSLIERDIKGS